jgi:tripartite-type tricarboxylate transporter receptor subunit TctC
MLDAGRGDAERAARHQDQPGLLSGPGPAKNDLISGQIDYMVEVSLTALAQIQANTVRPLAVFRSARISTLPDVPSTNEFGIDGLDFPVWLGFLAPKGRRNRSWRS